MSNMDHCEKRIIKVESFLDEQINPPKDFEDTGVDIVSWTNKGDFASNKNEDLEATDYSSLFTNMILESILDSLVGPLCLSRSRHVALSVRESVGKSP